jgi:hypothetical protein
MLLFVVIVVESNEKEKETCTAMLTRSNGQCSLAADISIGNCLPLRILSELLSLLPSQD